MRLASSIHPICLAGCTPTARIRIVAPVDINLEHPSTLTSPLSTAPGVMGGGSGAPPAHTTAISCWLVPPEKPQAELSALVQRLAHENGLPAFEVHITIIGDVLGEHCSSVAEAIERLQLLAHAGAVPCRFASIECFPPWNQSLMAVAEESPERPAGSNSPSWQR